MQVQRTGLRLPWMLLLALLASGASRAQTTAAEDGALAPASTWYTRGGCASRSGAAATPPLLRPPARAWDYAVQGEIEGEPLVWDDLVLISERVGSDRRRLHVISLLDGRVWSKSKTFKSRTPLEPTIWGDRIVIRIDETTLQGLTMARGTLRSPWDWHSEDPLSAPLMFQREVYVRAGTHILRFDFGRDKPVWSCFGEFRGDPALRGDFIYAVQYDSEANAQLVLLGRDQGSRSDTTVIGNHDGSVPGIDQGIGVIVLESSVMVRHALPVRTVEGGSLGWTDVERMRIAKDRVDLRMRTLCDFLSDPAAYRTFWVGAAALPGLGRAFVSSAKDSFRVLGTADRNPYLVDQGPPPSVTEDIAYAGGSAVDLGEARLLWRLPGGNRGRLVPARQAVLFVEDAKKLVACRVVSGRNREWASDTGATTFEGTVVLLNGSVQKGALSLSAGERRVKLGTRGSWPLDEILLVSDADGRLHYWPSHSDGLRGIAILAEAELQDVYEALLGSAVKAGDPELLSRIIDEATVRGVPDARIKGPMGTLARWERAGKSTRKAGFVAELEAQERGALERARTAAWRHYEASAGSSPPIVKTALLRAVLEVDPGHAAATAAVRSLIPEDISPPDPFVAIEWLLFVEAIDRVPITIVPPPVMGRDNTPDQRALGAIQATWRRDLVGIKSPRLFIFTSLTNPSCIAQALSMGELVCDALEDVFSKGATKRDERFPLRLHLYETQAEYLAETRRHGLDGAESTAGHYSPSEGISRIFVPGDSSRIPQMLSTYAHELTHHWIAERCPLFGSYESSRQEIGQPGYWIVEGFASFVDEFEFDTGARTWNTASPMAESLDTVGNASDAQMLPWARVFSTTHEEFMKIPTKPDPKLSIPLAFRLDSSRFASWRNMFYDQAAAASHYLYHAEEGRYRERLLAYVASYYTCEASGLDIQGAFGLSAEELGARVRVYAAKVLGGALQAK